MEYVLKLMYRSFCRETTLTMIGVHYQQQPFTIGLLRCHLQESGDLTLDLGPYFFYFLITAHRKALCTYAG